MISNQILQNTLEGLKNISHAELCVLDIDGKEVASTSNDFLRCAAPAREFVESPADSQEIQGYQYFKIFDEQQLDYRIIECGIGGKNDKTNVIDSMLTAITNIGNDHLDQIGPTIYDVINEKMGIIQPHQYFVTSELSGTIIARLQEQCDVMDAMMVVVPEYDVNGYPFTFVYRDMEFTLKDQAAYQVTNARLALTIAHKLITLNQQATIKAVEEARWGGRYEQFEVNGKTVILDGAHNVPAIQALIHTLSFISGRPAVVFACLKDKDYTQMLSQLQEAGLFVYLTTFNDERMAELTENIDRQWQKVTPNYQNAIQEATAKFDTVVVTGSLHFISVARKYLIKVSR